MFLTSTASDSVRWLSGKGEKDCIIMRKLSFIKEGKGERVEREREASEYG